ncbi:hypothetical protein TRICI_004991 [Trichomonascus ciferrii]|uniref:Histidine biosynthesis trifunctional protein n=1 Tax=Trichomonascus ciferrii TaxID=44093 RepID=A0A642UXR4_9ASCO|nr:hypothetical protein TRICI_004991 [Trichomonascus ciferrii]
MFPVLPLVKEVTTSVIEEFKVLGHVLVPVEAADAEGIKNAFSVINVSVLDLKGELSVEAGIKLLDAGAAKIFTSVEQVNALAEAGVGPSRLVSVDDKDVDSEANSGVLLKDGGEGCKEFAKSLEKKLVKTGGAKVCYALGIDDPKIDIGPAIAVIEAEKVNAELAALFAASRLTTDRPDGLYTTLVVDQDDKALGLVYSSDESIKEAIRTQTGVYQSRRHGLWYKGATSGCTQQLLRLDLDCDSDCLKAVVVQKDAFCHNNTVTCFGEERGVSAMEKTLISRKINAPQGSYTARLFNDEKLLNAKIMEEAEELCEAKSKDEVAWEAADLIYFAMTKLAREGVSWADVENNLDAKARKISRRKGDAKPKWENQQEAKTEKYEKKVEPVDATGEIKMARVDAVNAKPEEITKVLSRPSQSTDNIMKLVLPIIDDVRKRGDKALIDFTAKFEKAQLSSPVLEAPFPEKLMELSDEIRSAIDLSIANVEKFHAAQVSTSALEVETAKGVICSRFARPIESVGLYIPGGTAVLPSTALMLGVPAKVAGCKNIVIATPPRSDGTPTPEVVYVANKVGAKKIVLAGGAQAVASMAYGTESVPKVDKIMGPGNQFVTAAKMYVQNDTTALVSIDMPAGPSEVLVVADKTANPAFVASDLLSQAEHGVDSQVILLAVDLSEEKLSAIEKEVHEQAMRLPRVEIVRKCIAHSTTLQVKTIEQAMDLSNQYGPEHLILQIENASSHVRLVNNAGSVFVGPYSPESCGDYSSGTNHTLPTYGYAKMYSGVNTGTFQKHITSQELTAEGLKNIGNAVMTLAEVEGLHAHRNAVQVRLDAL